VSISRTLDAFMGVCNGASFEGDFKNNNQRSDSYMYVVQDSANPIKYLGWRDPLLPPIDPLLPPDPNIILPPEIPVLKEPGWHATTTDFTTTPPQLPTPIIIDHTKLVLVAPTLGIGYVKRYIFSPTDPWPIVESIEHYATAATFPFGVNPHIEHA
jgi:hypothetical protein